MVAVWILDLGSVGVDGIVGRWGFNVDWVEGVWVEVEDGYGLVLLGNPGLDGLGKLMSSEVE